MKSSPRLIWTYEFDETSIDTVLQDIENFKFWEQVKFLDKESEENFAPDPKVYLAEGIITDICDAFASSIIWKLPNGFCVRRVDEFWKEVELYTFY